VIHAAGPAHASTGIGRTGGATRTRIALRTARAEQQAREKTGTSGRHLRFE
jgi:hypothetical protein